MSSASLPTIRLVAQLAAGIGVHKVLRDVIQNNVSIVTTYDAMRVSAGTLVLGSMIAAHASNHVDERITAVLAWLESRKTETDATASQ